MKKWLMTLWGEMLEIKSTKKELREFGLVMGVFFLLLAGFAFWKNKNFLPLFSVSGFFLILAYLNPFLLKPLQKLWMGFAVIMGYFMTRFILVILFFLVLTPISLVARLTGKKFLDMEFKKSGDSYWIPKSTELIPKEHYERQF